MLILCMPGVTEPTCTICTLTATQTVTNPSLVNPYQVAISPTGNCIALASNGNAVIASIALNDTCMLGSGMFAPDGSGQSSGTTSVAFSPDGTCIAVTNNVSNTVSMFSVSHLCMLVQIGSAVSTGGTGAGSVAFSPDGTCLAVANFDSSNVQMFSVSNCGLTAVGTPVATGLPNPNDVAFSPGGGCLATANYNMSGVGSSISMFSVSSCGLTYIADFSRLRDNAFALAFSPTNNCLALAYANQPDGYVGMYQLDPTTCKLSFISEYETGGNACTSVAFSPSGLCLAATNQLSNNITMFEVDSTCHLNAIDLPITSGGQAFSASFSPSGDCLAVGNLFNSGGGGSGSITMFTASSQDPLASLAASSTSICPGHSSTLTATVTGGIEPFTYVFPDGTVGPTDDRTVTHVVTPAMTTAYDVVVTDGNSCVSTSNTVTITVNPNPTVSLAASPPLVCFGNSSTLTATVTTASADYTYTFSDGFVVGPTPDASVMHTVTPSATENYTVTVTDGNGCVGASNISTVTVDNPLASLSASPPLVCVGNSSTLTATVAGGTAPYVYLFSDGFSETTSATSVMHAVTPSVTTNYTVTITDANGCASTSGISTVTVDNPLATLSASPTVICAGNSSTLTASIVGGTAPYTYVFSDGFTSGPTPSTSIAYVVSPSATTNYTVTITDANGCIATSSETTVTLDILSVAITPAFQGVIKGSTITLTAMPSAGISPFSFAWQTPGRGAFSGQSISLPNATISDIGTYMLTMTDSNGCQASNSAKVVITPSGNGSKPTQPLVLISNTSSATITGTGTPGSTISIFVTDPFVGTTVVDSAGNFSFTLPPLPNGRYTVTLSSTFDGLTVSSSFTLIIRANQSTLSSLITAKYNCST